MTFNPFYFDTLLCEPFSDTPGRRLGLWTSVCLDYLLASHDLEAPFLPILYIPSFECESGLNISDALVGLRIESYHSFIGTGMNLLNSLLVTRLR
jgi:hypothetical protein